GRGLGDHAFERDGLAALALALVGGLHEGHDFDGFLGRHRRLAPFEELADFDDQRLISAVAAAGGDALAAEDQRAVIVLAGPHAAERADPAVAPDAGRQFRVFGLRPRDALAARPHDRIQRFDAVNSVPVQARVVLFQRAGAIGVTTEHVADLVVVQHGDDAGAETQRRTGKAGHAALLAQPEDLDRVGQRAGAGLVDEDPLAGREDRRDLFQVRTSVDAFQQHGVDFGQQGRDRVDDFNAIFLAQLLGETLDPVTARSDVGTAARIGGHDLHARELAAGLRIVQDAGKGDDVRGIEPDDADADRRGFFGF